MGECHHHLQDINSLADGNIDSALKQNIHARSNYVTFNNKAFMCENISNSTFFIIRSIVYFVYCIFVGYLLT